MPHPVRRHRSPWPFVSLIPLGLGAWAPAYAGARVHRQRWVVWGVLWSLITIGGWVDAIVTNGNGGAGGLLILLGWAGSVATSFSIRPAYDRELASPFEQEARAGEQRLQERHRALQLSQRDPALAREMGIGRPDRPGAADAGLVDVNNAPIEVLRTLPGVGSRLASQIVSVRERIDGFSSLEDLGETLDIDGGIVEGLRERVVFLPRE